MNATHGNGVQATNTPLRKGLSGAADRFGLPADCRRILVVGAGGFGREVLQWARDAWPDHAGRIAGFLSADDRVLDGFDSYPPIVCTPNAYVAAPGDKLLLGIGVPYVRRQVAESLLARGVEFLTLVHPTALVAASATIEHGAILCPYAIASDSCRVGRFVIMNYHSSLGHDASAGDFAVLSPYATLGGHAHVAEDVFLGLHASVGPGKTVGERTKVSANSCVLSCAPGDALVFGVPGRIGRRVPMDASSRGDSGK